MTYLSPPGADDPRQPGNESSVPPADPTYPPTQYPAQPDPLYQPYQPYQVAGAGYPPPAYPYQPSPYQQPYPYGYADPYAQMGYPAQRPTDGMAIAALVVSCVGIIGVCGYGIGGLIGIVGAILGHVARGRIRRSGADGDSMALAGIIMGWIATALGILIIAFFVIFIWAVSNSADTTTTATT